jgi:hypothetical protein
MNRHALKYLYDLGEICGKPLGRQMCLLKPGHVGYCDRWFPQGKPTREEKLARTVATLKAQRDRRQRHREHLVMMLRREQQARARDRAYLGFRIEYRIIGFGHRLRRYWRMVYHRTICRALGTWPRKTP